MRFRWIVLRYLAIRRPAAASGRTALAVEGARTGRRFRVPVRCAPLGRTSLVVLPGHATRKSWWRRLGDERYVEVFDAGIWVPARARVVSQGCVDWSVARSAYIDRWHRVHIDDRPLLVVDLRPVRADLDDHRERAPTRDIAV